MSINTLREKNVNQLKEQLTDLLREQFNLRMQKGVGEAPRPHLYKQVRREIARVKTVIQEKEAQS